VLVEESLLDEARHHLSMLLTSRAALCFKKLQRSS